MPKALPEIKLSDDSLASIVVGGMLLIPIMLAFGVMGSRAMFSFLAADTMYYLDIASNVWKYGIPTMDGESLTNGFHPLWEFILIGIFAPLHIPHHFQVYVVFVLSVLFVYAAYAMVAGGLLRILGKWPGLVATLTLFPGAYALFFEPRRHVFGAPGLHYTLSPLSAINGMETPVSLALWAFFFLKCAAPMLSFRGGSAEKFDIRPFFPLSVRLCLAALVLARLDDCFLMVAIGLFVLFQHGVPFGRKIRTLWYIGWPTGVAMITYVVFNLETVGIALPLSALSKISSSEDRAFYFYGSVLLGHPGNWWHEALRLYVLLVALLVGCCGRKFLPQASGKPGIALFAICALFLIMKALFLLLAVPFVCQGYWYYFSMVGICNVMFALAIGAAVKAHSDALRPVLYFCLAVIAFHMPNDLNAIESYVHDGPSMDKSIENYANVTYLLWRHDEEIRRFLMDKAPGAKLVETLDGMFAYLLDMPAEGVTGLASSPDEIKRRKAVGLWKSVIPRGFTLVPDYGYVTPASDPKTVKIVEELHPPFLPFSFFRVELVQP